jgi:hypothetical protein
MAFPHGARGIKIGRDFGTRQLHLVPPFSEEQGHSRRRCKAIGRVWLARSIVASSQPQPSFRRWLSEQEGMPEDQLCYPPLPQIKPLALQPSQHWHARRAQGEESDGQDDRKR